MACEHHGASLIDYLPCRYGTSKLLFRGPRRSREGDYIAFLGGAETYGRFHQTPFPALFEQLSGLKAVNFGCVNAGADTYLAEPEIVGFCRNARVTVIEVTGAQNITNRFYSVHPRRNDRFVKASKLLKSLYSDVDFTEFNFTRHLLSGLQNLSSERFDVVLRELRDVWVGRHIQLAKEIGGKIILLWLSDHMPEAGSSEVETGTDPLFVDREMLNAMRPHVSELVEYIPGEIARSEGIRGLLTTGFDLPAAEEQLSAGAHSEIAALLRDRIRALASENQVE